ncbi:MAG: DNA primase [Planctomycetes bacterium]|nr:DNA primase [Planctomycetota bacterium]
MSDDFQQIKEAIKLRSPIEEIVRERVPDLHRAGALWVACCPFHQEKTPSFKVDPRKGTWHCYGACSKGGNVIDFVMTAYNVEFLEALEILGARCGIALPERRAAARAKDELEPRYELMARAEAFYRKFLRRPEGAQALAYMRGRGLTDTTIDAFGIGFAPAQGAGLVDSARRQRIAVERLVELGLARVDDSGRAYDFFKGRVMFPVRDHQRRTVGFGARRLSDEDKRSPKYINTPETPLFHKGRLFYALDHALEHVRRHGHLVVVEGYTDVMAAHQVGLRSVVAVLGTATTEDHAALVRRSGARRISLLFDGDEAGRKATVRALDGLLPLDLPIDVVRLPGDEDPCDLLVREGAAPLEHHLERATPWFAFLVEWISAAAGDERYRALDTVLALLARISKPVQRDERIAQLAGALGVPVESVRAQFESLPQRRRESARSERERAAPSDATTADSAPRAVAPSKLHLRLRQALRGIAGASLIDPSLALHSDGYAALCDERDLARILAVLGELHRKTLGTFAIADVFDTLGDDPAREQVSTLVAEASLAESAFALFEQNAQTITRLCEALHHEEQLRLVRAGGAIDAEQLRALEEMRRARFTRGQHV